MTRVALALLALATLLPLGARAEPRLLDAELRPPLAALALAAAEPPPGSMDFDLLGEAKPPPPAPDQRRMARRRKMLTWHQGIGLGLLGLQLATTTVGQLNYSDRFAGGPSTARYRTTHAALAYTNVAVFALNGTLALLAPNAAAKQDRGFDRVTQHKWAMFTAAAGMLTQGALGIYTSRREGFQDQERFATIHLAIGYATLAAIGYGVGAIVF
jgi:hypothetical protein